MPGPFLTAHAVSREASLHLQFRSFFARQTTALTTANTPAGDDTHSVTISMSVLGPQLVAILVFPAAASFGETDGKAS